MAYFAKLGTGGVVEQVIVVDDGIATSELEGVDYLNALYKTDDVWKQTYPDELGVSKRKQYAGIDFRYDSELDIFIKPQPYPSWIIDENNDWQPPIPRPEPMEDASWFWDEDNESWVA
jgi:hypothetical protein